MSCGIIALYFFVTGFFVIGSIYVFLTYSAIDDERLGGVMRLSLAFLALMLFVGTVLASGYVSATFYLSESGYFDKH